MSTICDAIKSGDLIRVRQMIDADPSLFRARSVGMSTPVHIAALHGRCDVLAPGRIVDVIRKHMDSD